MPTSKPHVHMTTGLHKPLPGLHSHSLQVSCANTCCPAVGPVMTQWRTECRLNIMDGQE